MSLVVVTFAPVLHGQTTQPEPAPAASPPSWDRLLEQETLTDHWFGVGRELEQIGIRFEMTYQQQWQQNFHGGLDTHNAQRFSGTLDYEIELDFEKMHLLPGGSFFLKARSGYGEGINDAKVGALYDVNGDTFRDVPIFVRKWWYRQTFLDERIELRIGRIQTQKDLFDVSLYANHEDEDFMNNLLNRNGILPQTNGMGVFLKVQPLEWMYVQAAAIDAQAEHRTRTGFDTGFHDESWYNAFWEVGFTPEWQTSRGAMPGRYRIGWWFDPRVRPVFMDTQDGKYAQRYRGEEMGLYVGLDQMVWKENDDPQDEQGLGLFGRFAVTTEDTNLVSHAWELGASYRGLISGRDEDVMGFAVGQAILSREYRARLERGADRETVYEWYYRIQLTPWCHISPDVQVITQPGGLRDGRNALVAGLRLLIIF